MEITLRKSDIPPDVIRFFRPSWELGPKNDLGIPWRVALALQADGWYLRSEIIWSKPNPLPESVRDRPTKSHEQVFLLTKQERYFYDAEAIKERATDPEYRARGKIRPGIDPLYIETGDTGSGRYRSGLGAQSGGRLTRNRRSVWTIAASPFKGSHFAVMPTKLAATCIRAGTSRRGCCPTCGKPWVRVLETIGKAISGHPRGENAAFCAERSVNGATLSRNVTEDRGFRPGCSCDAGEPVPCRVFDPFGGVGTTVLAASNLGRVGIATELGSKYLAMARRRLERPHARHVRPERADRPMPLFDREPPP